MSTTESGPPTKRKRVAFVEPDEDPAAVENLYNADIEKVTSHVDLVRHICNLTVSH